jgi:uncharacterized protein
VIASSLIPNGAEEHVSEVRAHKRQSWTKGGPVLSHLSEHEISELEERSIATIADPTPLGMWGLATGTWMAGVIVAGFFPENAMAATIPVLLVFAGLVQFLAGLYAFRRTNVLAATAFCCFGSFNVTAAICFALQNRGVLPTTGETPVFFGFLLESFAFMAFSLTIAALPTNAAVVLVLGTLAIGYALSGIPYLADSVGHTGWAVVQGIGGWFLVASAFFAYYTGAAIVVNSVWNRTVLPLGGEP